MRQFTENPTDEDEKGENRSKSDEESNSTPGGSLPPSLIVYLIQNFKEIIP